MSDDNLNEPEPLQDDYVVARTDVPPTSAVRTDIDVHRKDVLTNADRPPLLSWGAIFGGLVTLIAVSWLLYLLGTALGISVADATDGEAIGLGLTTASVIWILLSSLIAFFIGAMATARLSGKVDDTVGMLHGMTLWGLATTLMVVLSYFGISNLLQTGTELVSSTTKVATTAITEAGSGLASTGSMVASAAQTKLGENIQARIKRRASSVLSKMDAEGGPEIDKAEVRESIESLNSDDLSKVATHITAGEMTMAKETLADATDLSQREISDLVEGISAEFEEQLGTDNNDTDLAGDIANAIKRQSSDLIADLDANGGPKVSQKDVRDAMKELSPETMKTVAYRLVSGDVQGAKDNLTANTNLSSRQINDIVDGVNEDVSRTVDKYQREAAEVADAAADYAAGVLWAAFAASALGLAVSILGGWLGTETTRQLQVEVRTVGDRNQSIGHV